MRDLVRAEWSKAEVSGDDSDGLRVRVTWRAGVPKPCHGVPNSHGKTCTQKAREGSGGLSHRNIYEDHSSCQMDGLGGKNGARKALRKHPREPRLGGGCPALQMVRSSVIEDKFGEM